MTLTHNLGLTNFVDWKTNDSCMNEQMNDVPRGWINVQPKALTNIVNLTIGSHTAQHHSLHRHHIIRLDKHLFEKIVFDLNQIYHLMVLLLMVVPYQKFLLGNVPMISIPLF